MVRLSSPHLWIAALRELAVHSLLFLASGKATRRKWQRNEKSVGLGILLASCKENYTCALVDDND